MGSYWISFKKTPQISEEFWCHRVRINRIISEHSLFHAIQAIEYMIKSKTESPTTRRKMLLRKLSEYTIELKYQKGSKMHTSNALS